MSPRRPTSPPPSPRAAAVTVDLDALEHYRAIHGLAGRGGGDGPDPAYEVGVRRLLDFVDELDIPATLFVIGSDAGHPAHAELLARASRGGHELASHSHSHHYDLRERPLPEIRDELARAEDALAAIDGRSPVGFRAPGYNLDARLLSVCAERGYLYDSSIFPCPPYYLAKAAVMGWLALRGRPSRSAMTRPEALLAPITPYHPDRRAFWRPGAPGEMPLEIPMCVVPGVRFPVIGTSLHLLGAAGFDAVWPLLRRSYRDLVQLEFHAIDFMDASDPGCGELAPHQPDLRVPWTRKRELYTHVFERVGREAHWTTLRDFAARDA